VITSQTTTAHEVMARLQARPAEVKASTLLWQSLIALQPPSIQRFNLWIEAYGFPAMLLAIRKCSRKLAKFPDLEARFLWGYLELAAKTYHQRTQPSGGIQ
jgi:hypothetical protein